MGGVYILPASLAPFGFSRSRLPPRYSTAVPRASASALLASSAPAFSTRASLVDYDDDEIDLSFSTSAASAHALPTPIHDSYLIDINASSANAVRQAASGGLAQLRVANIIGGHIGSLAPPPSSATSAASAVSVADIAQRRQVICPTRGCGESLAFVEGAGTRHPPRLVCPKCGYDQIIL